jgi:hypothetical protein
VPFFNGLLAGDSTRGLPVNRAVRAERQWRLHETQEDLAPQLST